MIFKMCDCDFGFKYNSVDYAFDHVDEVTIEDPEFTRLTRGANATNKEGLVYKEGTKEPKTWTTSMIQMSIELKAILDTIYKNKDRVEVYAISRVDGSSKMAKKAILCQQPQQLTLTESPDSMNVSLIFQSFDLSEVHKS